MIYETVNKAGSDSVSSVGGIPIPNNFTTDALKSICVSIKFMDTCVASWMTEHI